MSPKTTITLCALWVLFLVVAAIAFQRGLLIPTGADGNLVTLSITSDVAHKLFMGLKLYAQSAAAEKASAPLGSPARQVATGSVKPKQPQNDPVAARVGAPPNGMRATDRAAARHFPLDPPTLCYQLVVNRNGHVAQIPDAFVFRPGDQFRLMVEVSVPADVKLLQRDRSGLFTLLFHDARLPTTGGRVPASGETTIPPSGWFQFNNLDSLTDLILVATPQHAGPPLIRWVRLDGNE
jgi:hypothetical protein